MKTTIKHFLALAALAIFGTCANAQSFSFGDLFGQQSKLRQLMAEQIVQVRLYAGVLKTGYRIAGNGLHLSEALKNGTLDLHKDYFQSLEQVNPMIAKNPKGKSIAELDLQVRRLLANEWRWQQQQRLLRDREMSYFQQVRDNLLSKCQLDLDELLQVLTPGKLQLTDAERLARLDRLYDRMKDKQAFTGSFTARCRKLALGRQQHQKDREAMRKLYGIH